MPGRGRLKNGEERWRPQIPQRLASFHRGGSPWGGRSLYKVIKHLGRRFKWPVLRPGATSHLQTYWREAAASGEQHSGPPRLPPWHAHSKVRRKYLDLPSAPSFSNFDRPSVLIGWFQGFDPWRGVEQVWPFWKAQHRELDPSWLLCWGFQHNSLGLPPLVRSNRTGRTWILCGSRKRHWTISSVLPPKLLHQRRIVCSTEESWQCQKDQTRGCENGIGV